MTAYTSASAPTVHVGQVEGTAVEGQVTVKVVAETPQQLVLDVRMAAGGRSSPHRHPCDTAGVMLEGRVRAWVDGEESTLEPGDGFHHPEHALHHVEALEDSRWIEIKSPPVVPW